MARTLMVRLPLLNMFEHVLESLIKNPIVADIIVFRVILSDFLFCFENGMLCVLNRIALMR